MDKTVKKIGIILAVVILLPAAFFTVYEINSLNESEEMLETIYTSQLDAILFTVNQYTEDVVRSYAARLNTIPAGELTSSAIRNALSESEAIFYAAAVDTFTSGNIIEVLLDTLQNIKSIRNDFSSVIKTNADKVSRLYSYSREGFQKFEPVVFNGNIHLLFVSRAGSEQRYLFGFVINPGRFVNNVLAPKLQSVAQDQFILKISRENETIYSTEADDRPPQLSRGIWLAPEYSLGILLSGTTIDELVQERFYTNIIIIALLGVILIIGVWIVFRSIKREIEFAQVKSDFVSNVSHELRTPLALISMFAETLDMGRARTEEKKKEYVKIISQETNRLSSIVNKILNFSKMEAGKRTYNIVESDINEVASKVYDTYRFHLKNNGFSSSFNPAENIPPVKIDPDAVSEALINLIDNAMKYSEDEKNVQINTGLEDDYVYLEVKDKGVGISEENQKKVFEKFFRVTSGLVHNTKGTGLGLTLVKHIIDAHKGDIELKSRRWEGSTFRLKFPLNNKTKSR
jgi:two-component system, OmpR family, phosphate regulon sensor histidine kinase PhoR